MKCKLFPACCNKDFWHRKPINNTAARLSPAILSSKFPSTQGVGSMGGRRRKGPRIIDRIKRCITTIVSIQLTVSFQNRKLAYIYYTFVHISFRHSFNIFILITRRLFESWHEGAPLVCLLAFLPAPGEAENLSMVRITMTLWTRYPKLQ